MGVLSAIVVACDNLLSSCENSLSNLDCFFFVFFFASGFMKSFELLLVVHGFLYRINKGTQAAF
jgi:hypothetical protein